MNAVRKIVILLMTGILGISANAQIRSAASQRRTVAPLIRRLENDTSRFRDSLDSAINGISIDNTRAGENISTFLADFDDSLRRFHDRFDQRAATTADVQDVLNRSSAIDRFMRRHSLDSLTQSNWSTVRGDLNQLARIYGVSWSAANRSYPPYPPTPADLGTRLTGTFQLDPSSSDDPRAAVDRVLASLPYNQRGQMRDQMLRRIEPPEQIAIEVRGRTATLASTKAPQISFNADGLDQTETTPSGRTIRTRATLDGDQLTVSNTGDRNTQFNVTISPLDNGRRLRVTRQVYAERLSQPIVIQSYYYRTADVARFDIYSGPREYPTTGNNTDFVIRNGETVEAELNDPLSTRTAREGDRFTATIRLPAQYAGATLGGYVSNVQRSGRLTGRSEMTLSFDSIRLRDGRSYSFAGILQTVRTSNGEMARIDNEGAIQEESQTNRTAERTAIGTAVGAIIGAIAGGGKGAAIGAIVGAGGGAGSVYIQGRDDLDLMRGTEMTIRATGPR